MLDRLPQQPGPCTSISRRRAKRCVGMSPVAAYARHEKRKNRVPSHDRGSPSIGLRSGVAPCRGPLRLSYPGPAIRIKPALIVGLRSRLPARHRSHAPLQGCPPGIRHWQNSISEPTPPELATDLD